MTLDRRKFLTLAAGGATSSAWRPPRMASPAVRPRYRAIAFDAFPIFDPRPVAALAEALFPGKGAEFSTTWRTRQFEYQWLRALGGHYADFWQATEEALVFAARMSELELTEEKRARLMRAFLELEPWPDAGEALGTLKEAGVRLAFLSNMTQRMLESGIGRAGMEGVFEHVLSTDRIRTYKPDPRSYQLAVDAFGLEREEILFAAFAGWDAAGARWFGYPTFWVNRLGHPSEELGVSVDATGRGLADLASHVLSAR